jgi:hypothetical protein
MLVIIGTDMQMVFGRRRYAGGNRASLGPTISERGPFGEIANAIADTPVVHVNGRQLLISPKADFKPNKIIQAVRRGHQVLDSIH